MKNDPAIYRELQQHLDKMPVAYPATASGVELRLLKFLFTPGQARIALGLDYKPRSVEQVRQNLPGLDISLEELEARLEEMVDKGNTFCKKKDGRKVYSTIPFVVGMLEFQEKALTPELLRDTQEYFEEKYAAEYLSTAVPQMRVIPVRKSITAEHRIGTYDELKTLIEGAEGRIRIGECICRESAHMAGRSCTVTSRKQTCMGFRDFADLMGRTGWGRPVSKEEALEIAAKSEEEGLVLQPANQQRAEFICACCGDCCGILRMAKATQRPADFVATNYYAQVNTDLCSGCGTCVERCQMGAVEVLRDIAEIMRHRCIGCGVCVPTCPSDAIGLVNKEPERVPPVDMEDLYETIMEKKRRRV
jgi:Na+-translocating ferredoxin:NAD+ oxidoreductase subunit B